MSLHFISFNICLDNDIRQWELEGLEVHLTESVYYYLLTIMITIMIIQVYNLQISTKN